MRRKQYSVVLFDEVEKAHGDVLNVLLQVLDDGRLTDSLGKTVSFENTVRERRILSFRDPQGRERGGEEGRRPFSNRGARGRQREKNSTFFCFSTFFAQLQNHKPPTLSQIVVLTSNIGAHILLDQNLPAKAKKEAVLAACRNHFRPELLNRLDDIIVFDALTPEMLRAVARIAARGLEARLLARGVALTFTDEALAWATTRSYDPSYGARPLRRWLEKNVVTALSRKLIAGEVEEGDLVEVGVSPDAAAKAAAKQRQKAATSDDEDWVAVDEEDGGNAGLIYVVKKGQGPPVAGADASCNAASNLSPSAGTKRSKMEMAPSDALTEEEMED